MLGTTLVQKGVAPELIHDPPAGDWLAPNAAAHALTQAGLLHG